MLVVVDGGNFSTKVVFGGAGTEMQTISFSSVSHAYIPFADDDFRLKEGDLSRVQYIGLDKYIGEGAKSFYSSKKDEHIYTGNVVKGHYDGALRIVLGLYRIYQQTGQNAFDLVVTSPVKSRKRDKLFFEDTFSKNTSALIDGQPFQFSLTSFRVGAEGLGAKFFVPQKNCIIVDAGSQTTNLLRFIEDGLTEDSETLNMGTENATIEAIADTVYRNLSRVDLEYQIRTTGGKSRQVAQALSRCGFQNCLEINAQECENYFLNAVGLFRLIAKLSQEESHG